MLFHKNQAIFKFKYLQLNKILLRFNERLIAQSPTTANRGCHHIFKTIFPYKGI